MMSQLIQNTFSQKLHEQFKTQSPVALGEGTVMDHHGDQLTWGKVIKSVKKDLVETNYCSEKNLVKK